MKLFKTASMLSLVFSFLISFKAQAQVAPQATFKYHVENNSFRK